MEATTARIDFLAPRRAFRRTNWAWRQLALTRAAAHVAVTRAVLSHVPLLRTRVERRLPALLSLRGHRPAQEMSWAGLGKRAMSTPISATMTWATRSLIPGMVVSRRARSRI